MSNLVENVKRYEKTLNENVLMKAFHSADLDSDGKLTPMWCVGFVYKHNSYKERLKAVIITANSIKLRYKYLDDDAETVLNWSKYDQCNMVLDNGPEIAEQVFDIATGFYKLMETIKTNALW